MVSTVTGFGGRGVVAFQSACIERASGERDAAGHGSMLVLGIGNSLLGDDGVGVHVVERLRAHPAHAAVRFVDGGTLSFTLLALLQDADAMLVADAAELGAPPGAVHLYENEAMDRFLAGPRRRSVHEVGLCELLDMARLGDCLPPRRALLCVQPADIGWSESLSPAVAGALAEACAAADALLRRWRAA